MPNVARDIHECACLVFRLTGLPWFIREFYTRHKVTIINYHDPSPEIFSSHMELFAQCYHFISISQLTAALGAKDFTTLPAKPMLVTLDDGHIGNAQLFDTLRKHAIPAVIYAVAGVVNTRRKFWFEHLAHDSAAIQRLKEMGDKQRRHELDQVYGHRDEREYGEATALSAGQLQEFIGLGGTVGAHSVFHPLLDKCEPIVGQRETAVSRSILEALLGSPILHFALPNGNGDINSRLWVELAGYLTCRTTKPGWVGKTTDPMALPNFGIADDANSSKALIQACGLWDLSKNLIRMIFNK